MYDLKNNICLLGENVDLLQKELDLIQDKNIDKIENLWNIISFELKDKNKEIDTIFDQVIDSLKQQNKKYSKKIFSYTIIYALDILNEEKENYLKSLLNKIVKAFPDFFDHPFIILLGEDESNKNKIVSFINREIQNIGIDKRNISFFTKIKEKEMVRNKILKIFSYFYERGDEFEHKNKKFKLYKMTEEKYYPINFLILGRTQVGKSTFINTLLGEKRAKEGGKGSSITQNQLIYHLDNIPLEINDIEGFTGEETINKVVEKIKNMQKRLGEKELHIVIYILNYDETTTVFNNNEYLIFKQLTEKLDNTQFLFVCTRSKKNVEDNKIERIRDSFYNMIEKGEESDKNIMNTLGFLYYCQKKEIYYEEIENDIKKEIKEEKFKEMNFFEKLNLKFKNYEREKKIDEMINIVLEKDKTLLFVNLIKDKEHEEIFGMKNVSQKLREALTYIKENNMKFINANVKINEIKENELKQKIEKLKKQINEIEDEKNNINHYIDSEIHNHNTKEDDERRSLLNTSLVELQDLEVINKDYIELINCLAQDKMANARSYAEKIKDKNLESVRNKVKTYGRLTLACVFGLIPVVDILIEKKIKKNVQKEIAGELNDELIDLNDNDIKLSKEEENFFDLEKFKKDTNDVTSNTLKTIGKIGGWLLFGFLKVGIFLRFGFGIVGSAIGAAVSGFVMNYDINKYLEFYGKRLIYRYLVNLSFNKIEEYLRNNFENQE